ncbi:cytochrome P450 [Pholiota conissans]|uniref:Cytochrome P450 n=1 Tax=Pholiota conissans TaxID=109636 RepID=A0A9P6D5W3_9AGAR|nr:cytochrome P450 [Pholiota conissans]
MSYQVSILYLLGSLSVYAVYKVAKLLYDDWTAPIRSLPGPPNPSFIFGNTKQFMEKPDIIREEWIQQYGPTINFKVLFGLNRLFTIDTKALNHVLMNYHVYQKPEAPRHALRDIFGDGVLVVEEEKHKQQRKIMNPAFGTSHIRELTEIFVEKSIELRDVWMREINNPEPNSQVEVLSWLSKMTLDVIGKAGFNYNFDALSGKTNELNQAFSAIFESATSVSLLAIARQFFPSLRFIPSPKDSKIKTSRQTMDRIGTELMKESKADLTNQKTSWTRRDLLSLLIRANLSTDLPAGQRMSDKDVLAQVPTFLVAGHETTSTGTMWALFALSQNLPAQAKLRQEVMSVSTDNPTMDELNALPYLDAVVRETLRVHPPVAASSRQAVHDDFLPFRKPIMDRNGKMIDGVLIKKGQALIIPIKAVNRDKSIWGEDANEFKPERWEKIPEAASMIPGTWGNLMTFLGGPRACIGYRFSLVEMKALLFTLIRAFEFGLAVPSEDIGTKTFIVQRPFLKSNPKAGNQMPLILKPVAQA